MKELRAEERERAKLEKEIEAERKKLEKEQKHYANALQQIIQQIASADPADLPALEEKKAELEAKANDIDCAIKRLITAQQTKKPAMSTSFPTLVLLVREYIRLA